jgi:predicted AAA+ superfamily ATPase
MNDTIPVIPRQAASTLLSLAKGFPIVAVTGPRQSGKTTLVQAVFPEKPYVSLEEPDKLELAISDPRGFLANYPDGAVIDEAQRFPGLFSYLQTLVDRSKTSGLFILTGSQQFGLRSKISQSLAGRAGLVELLPFSLQELAAARIRLSSPPAQIYKGLYPPIYDRKLSPDQWYPNYVLTYLERDVRNILNVRDLSSFQKFLRMCAGRSGQLVNLSSLASDCGVTHNTALSWISVLEASYIVFLLRPHHRNFGKRLVKSPKLYFYDSGLAAWLLSIQGPDHLAIHPQRGSLFEGLIISELLKDRFNRGLTSNLYFWRNNLGDEIDVVIDQGTRLVPVEIKSGETLNQDYFRSLKKWKKMTSGAAGPSYLVYGGEEHLVSENISVVPWNRATEFINTRAG